MTAPNVLLLVFAAVRAPDDTEALGRALTNDPDNAAIAADLGHALAKAGRREEAEAAFRAAIQKAPRRWQAYAGLADLMADDAARFERRDEIVTLLEGGLAALRDDRSGRLGITLRLANFERSIGRPAAARRRLEPWLGPSTEPRDRKRVLDLLQAIADDEKARALEDWPEPSVPAVERAALADAERQLAAGAAAAALVTADRLVAARPTWRGGRWLRARCLEAVGKTDEAARELTILLQLGPSFARGWRALGILLAHHGGSFEAERAGDALATAMALEPGWADLRALAARVAARREAKREMARPPAEPPSEKALGLYRQAQDEIQTGDPIDLARDFLKRALDDSPGFVEAAVAAYALTGLVGDKTVNALWNDGAKLLALATGVRTLGREGGKAVVRPWIDRAVELGVTEARFERALARSDGGDAQGALDDLLAYVAAAPTPEHLAEAQALRGVLAPAPKGSDPALRAAVQLLADRSKGGTTIGGPCKVGLPANVLVERGLVHEGRGAVPLAIDCYRWALAAAPAGRLPLERMAGIGIRAPRPLLVGLREHLEDASKAGVVAAHLGLGRLAEQEMEDDRALAEVEAYLAGTPPDDPARTEGVTLRDRLVGRRVAAAGSRQKRHVALAAAALAVVAIAFLTLFRGSSLRRLLVRDPGFFPDAARTIAELRHDVIKHRTSVLGLVASPDVPRAEIARALREPRPISVAVTEAYEALRTAAAARGRTLKPLRREPVFGPLVRDLERAEAWIDRPERTQDLLDVDRRLRGEHHDRVSELHTLGPRTTVSPSDLTHWIQAVETERRQTGQTWRPPSLHLQDLAVSFPVERQALEGVFANLLRNAEAAVAADADGRILVKIEERRDETGRRIAGLFVGDSAPAKISLEDVESRESGRGLAIVRDVTRRWRGHVVVEPEAAPFAKSIGACFPA